jgi:hypothetical protein
MLRHDLCFVWDKVLSWNWGGQDGLLGRLPKKGFGQIGEVSNHYVVADATFTEVLGRVPLWLFGFLG